MEPLFEFALCIKAIERELDRLFNEAVRPLGATAAQADALVVIDQAGPVSLGELGKLLIAEGGHPSRLVDRLVEAGLVERTRAGEDRRRIVLSLTARGRRLSRKVTAARRDMMALGEQLLPGPDLERTLRVLRRLVDQSSFAELVSARRELDR